MHLIVTSRSRIQAAYGADAFDPVQAALLDYSAALGSRIPHEILIIDDPASAAFLGISPATGEDATSIATSIRAARQAAGSNAITSILLVGGPDVIPFFQQPSPIPGDTDTPVATDNPYGCITADPDSYAVPDIPVGRAVGNKDDGLASLIVHLHSMAAFHNSAPALSGAISLGCSVWQSFTAEVLRTMDPGGLPQISPSYTVTFAGAADLRRRLLFFNLHGMLSGPDWWGADQNRIYDCVSPPSLGSADLSGAVIFTSNCYGAALENRTLGSCCALAAVKAGAMIFIGSTCLAYGTGSSSVADSDPRLKFSERLAQLFFENYTGAETAGAALVQARIRYVSENLIGNLLNPAEKKTALQFIFLGDPTL